MQLSLKTLCEHYEGTKQALPPQPEQQLHNCMQLLFSYASKMQASCPWHITHIRLYRAAVAYSVGIRLNLSCVSVKAAQPPHDGKSYTSNTKVMRLVLVRMCASRAGATPWGRESQHWLPSLMPSTQRSVSEQMQVQLAALTDALNTEI
eukprot:1154574-Pelagomonas_calceolata.AAC.4